MSRWFRFYGEALNDPKVQGLSGDLFKTWINLLCIASQHDGQLPANSELAYLLRRRSDFVDRDVNYLIKRGLIDEVNGHLEPHKWSDRQYKSDTSNERVKRHRDAKCNVTKTVTETPPDNRVQNTDTEKKESSLRSPARKRAARGSLIPEDWALSEDDRVVARSFNWTEAKIDLEAARFKDHSKANGRLHKDISAAWRNWVRSPFQQTNGSGPRPGSKEDTRERTVNALDKLRRYVRSNPDDDEAGGRSSGPPIGLLPFVKSS